MANRKKQIQAIQEKARDLFDELDSLIDELEEAWENMPENLQYSERGERMQERINVLDGWRGELEAIAEEEVE